MLVLQVWEKYTKSQAELDIEAASEAAEAEEAERVLRAESSNVTAEELQGLVADVVLDEKATRTLTTHSRPPALYFALHANIHSRTFFSCKSHAYMHMCIVALLR